MSIIFFVLGFGAGIFLLILFSKKEKKKFNALKDEKVRLEQEKEIVVEFMQNLAVAIGDGVARKDLYQRIAHTAVITTGAMSSCVYEKLSNGRLQGVATEGLFPPQRALRENLMTPKNQGLDSLKKFLPQSLEEGEGIVGEVAKTGKPVSVAMPLMTQGLSSTRTLHWQSALWSFRL